MTRLLRNKEQRRIKPVDNLVWNISSRPLDMSETRVLSHGLKHSVTPKPGYRPRLLYLVLRRLCRLGNESYLSRLRITSEVELLPLYNQRHFMTATWLETNNMR